MTPGLRRAVLVTLALAAATGVRAQTKRPMTIVDLLDVPALSDPQLSPDGRHVLYMIRKVDWRAGTGRRIAHIWRGNTDGTGAIQMTFGDNEVFPRWSPDGSRFTFQAVRSEAPNLQIYLMDNDGGEAHVLSRHAGGTSANTVTWAPDGKSIYFLATDPRSDEDTQRDRARDGLAAFEENLRPRHLWRISVADRTEQRITSGELTVIDYSLSDDGKHIVLARGPSALLDEGDRVEVWVADADGKNAVQITQNAIQERDPQLSPDGSRVLFVARANAKLEDYYNENVFLVPASGGAAEAPLPDFPHQVLRAAWAPDGKTIFAVANMGVHSEIVRIDPAARSFTVLTSGEHSIPDAAAGFWSIHASGVHVFMLDEPTRWGDVWTLPLAGGTPRRITDVYGYLDRDFKLPRQQRIEWKSGDGTRVEGLLFYPIDYDASKKYPLIVQPHGGPEESDKFGFWGITYYPQVLTGKGYMLLKPNYRGSMGYGNAFMRGVIGDVFRHAQSDLTTGVDALIAQGLVDGDRLAIMGFSAGAHLTNKIITATDRFKAASSLAGVANWLSFYAQTDIRTRRAGWFGGTPYQKDAPLQSYIDQSPLKDVWKVKTPTLFFVGENDNRVPRFQAIEMYRGVKATGTPTHLYIAPNEPHNWDSPRHWLAKANIELAWFEKHVMNRPYEDERAPGDPAPRPRTQ